MANQGLHYCTINTTVLCVTRPPIALHKKAASRYRVMRALGGILRIANRVSSNEARI